MVRLLNFAITGGRRLYWLPRTRADDRVDVRGVETERDHLRAAAALVDEQMQHLVDDRVAHAQLVLVRLAGPQVGARRLW